VVFDEAHEMEDVASDYFGRQISNYRFEELARDADQTLRLLHLGTPSLLRKHSGSGSVAGASLNVPAARRTVFVHTQRARGVPRAEREGYDSLVMALKSMETEFRGAGDKAGRTDAHRAAEFRIKAGAFVSVRIEREKLRLLVRAEEQRRVPDGHADRRQPDFAGAVVRTIRHGHTDSATLTWAGDLITSGSAGH